MTVNDRDLRILAHVLRFRHAFSDQVHRVFFEGRTTQAMHLVLKRLSDHGLIAQEYIPRNNRHRLGNLISLTDKGAEVLAEASGLSPAELGYRKRARKPHTIRFLYHVKRCIDFRIAMEYGLESTPLELKQVLTDQERVKRGGKLRPATAILDERGHVVIVPDLVYVLHSRRTGNDAVFFVEVDTGTETLGGGLAYPGAETVLSKLKRYEGLLLDRRQRWRERLDTMAGAFRVLFVTESDRRRDNILDLLRGEILHPSYFLLAMIDDLMGSGPDFSNPWVDGRGVPASLTG